MKEEKLIPVLVRIPPSLVRKLDKAAVPEGRSRNVEVRMRLLKSFKIDKKAAA